MPLTHLQLAEIIILVTLIAFSFWCRYRPLGLETIYQKTQEEKELLIVERSVESGFTVRNKTFLYTFYYCSYPTPSEEDAAGELVVEYVNKRPFRKKIILTAQFQGPVPISFQLADDETFGLMSRPKAYLMKEILRTVSEAPTIERMLRSTRSTRAAGRHW